MSCVTSVIKQFGVQKVRIIIYKYIYIYYEPEIPPPNPKSLMTLLTHDTHDTCRAQKIDVDYREKAKKGQYRQEKQIYGRKSGEKVV